MKLTNYRAPLLSVSLQSVITALTVIIFSVVFGLLAVTADPVIIGLGAGLVLGPILLLVPKATIWIILGFGFLFGVLSANPQFSKLTWVISLLSMLLLVPALTNVFWKKKAELPIFLLIAVVFLVYSTAISIVNWYSIQAFLGGFKRYFQSFGIMLALTMILFEEHNYRKWGLFLLIVATLQLPFSLYELLVLAPLRGGVPLSSATTDVVAGTFGANLEGGSPNSVMVTFLFIALAFLAARWRYALITNKKFCILALIFFLPLGMGETKIAVLMLPLVGVILLRKDFSRAPLRYIPAILVLSFLTFLLGYIYVTVLMHSTIDAVVESTLRYNVGNQGYSKAQILNRLTSITFWWQKQDLSDPIGFFIGNGLGSSFTTETATSGHVAAQYIRYGINLTAASTLLWDTGLIGLSLFLAMFIFAWLSANKLYNSTCDASVKADALGIQAAIGLFVLNIFYSDSIVNLVAMELIYAVILGYLGYLINFQRNLANFHITKV